MNKKLIFRILGALASALIIISVFVPYINVTGYVSSLWKIYSLSKALYLPIMIIVFGAIGVIFFSLNVKTEFAYMSTGAITFFVVMQTIDIVDQGTFSALSIGYYLLVIGAVLTGVMAFLINLKSKSDDVVSETNQNNQASVFEQINNLYNDQPSQEISPVQPVDIAVQPIQPNMDNSIQPVQPAINPTVQEFGVPAPVVSEQPAPVQEPQPVQPALNPTVQEFGVPAPVQEPQPVQPAANPTVQEFGVPASAVPEQSASVQPNVVLQGFNNSSSGNGQTDIFGQPINK